MMDHRGLAVHEPRRTYDFSSEDLPDALMAEADAQYGRLAGHFADDVIGDARLIGGARARRDDYPVGLETGDFGRGRLVIAEDLDLGPEFAQPLDEVIGERVVIVDDEDHRSPIGVQASDFRYAAL